MMIEYYPPRKNPFQAFVLSLKGSGKARFWLILAILALEGFYFYNVLAITQRSIQLYDLVIALGIVFVFPGYIYLMFAMRLRGQKRTLSISHEGLLTIIGGRTFQIPWNEINSIVAAEELVTIYGKSGDELYVPRSAFLDNQQRSEFIKLVSGYIHGAAAGGG
jgi:hypothetical protein